MPEGNEGFISDLDIRIWLRDRDPEANLLIKDYEFSPEELRTAQTLAVDAWNEEPPAIRAYTLYNFPFRHALLNGTAGKLLAIAAHRYRRNKLGYAVPGGAVDDQSKDVDYDAAADKLWGMYMDWVRRKKRALNVSAGWGRV